MGKIQNQEDRKSFIENEIKRYELKTKKIEYWLNFIKYPLTVIGAVVLFLLITRPDSIINRSSSTESIARERAKLLLEIFKEKDLRIRKLNLDIIKIAYPLNTTENVWIINFEKILHDQINKGITDSLKAEIEIFMNRRSELVLKLPELKSNIDEYKEGKQKIILIDKKIKELKSELEKINQ